MTGLLGLREPLARETPLAKARRDGRGAASGTEAGASAKETGRRHAAKDTAEGTQLPGTRSPGNQRGLPGAGNSPKHGYMWLKPAEKPNSVPDSLPRRARRAQGYRSVPRMKQCSP